ncbi:MAG: hypothetical protein Q4A66_03220 [Eubacteriales bacterium]|nr:hypothetical protein [Eubacteriales bacterium]
MRANPLREAAERLCPRIRRDRAEGLYIARGPLPAHPFFSQTARGEHIVLLPTQAACGALSQALPTARRPGFAPFTGRPFGQEDALLLARAVKLLETGGSAAELFSLERSLRQYAAVLLRTKATDAGGALPLCMRIVETLRTNGKENEP